MFSIPANLVPPGNSPSLIQIIRERTARRVLTDCAQEAEMPYTKLVSLIIMMISDGRTYKKKDEFSVWWAYNTLSHELDKVYGGYISSFETVALIVACRLDENEMPELALESWSFEPRGTQRTYRTPAELIVKISQLTKMYLEEQNSMESRVLEESRQEKVREEQLRTVYFWQRLREVDPDTLPPLPPGSQNTTNSNPTGTRPSEGEQKGSNGPQGSQSGGTQFSNRLLRASQPTSTPKVPRSDGETSSNTFSAPGSPSFPETSIPCQGKASKSTITRTQDAELRRRLRANLPPSPQHPLDALAASIRGNPKVWGDKVTVVWMAIASAAGHFGLSCRNIVWIMIVAYGWGDEILINWSKEIAEADESDLHSIADRVRAAIESAVSAKFGRPATQDIKWLVQGFIETEPDDDAWFRASFPSSNLLEYAIQVIHKGPRTHSPTYVKWGPQERLDATRRALEAIRRVSLLERREVAWKQDLQLLDELSPLQPDGQEVTSSPLGTTPMGGIEGDGS